MSLSGQSAAREGSGAHLLVRQHRSGNSGAAWASATGILFAACASLSWRGAAVSGGGAGASRLRRHFRSCVAVALQN